MRLRQASDTADPVVTDALLKKMGEKFNHLMHDVHITNTKRPAVIGALMLALWRAGKYNGTLDTPEQITSHAVQYCEEAFAHANDPKLLAEMLGNELKAMLAQRDGPKTAKKILDDLRFLGVGVHRTSNGGEMSLSADFLGQLYGALAFCCVPHFLLAS